MVKLCPYIPEEVERHKEYLYDRNLDICIPVNETAYLMLLKADKNTDYIEIAEEIEKMAHVGMDRVTKDVIAVFSQLNEHYLLNWANRGTSFGSKIQALFLNLIRQYNANYHERVNIKRKNLFGLFTSLFFSFGRKIGMLLIMILIGTIVIRFCKGDNFFADILVGISLASLGVFFSSIIHELAHLYTYWKIAGDCSKGYIAIDRGSVKIMRPDELGPNENILVSLLGPLIPGMIGLIIWGCGIIFANGIFYLYTIGIAAMFIIHLFNLLPFWGDGKNIMKQLIVKKNNKIMYKILMKKSEDEK